LLKSFGLVEDYAKIKKRTSPKLSFFVLKKAFDKGNEDTKDWSAVIRNAIRGLSSGERDRFCKDLTNVPPSEFCISL
jgi:hypothetical protein